MKISLSRWKEKRKNFLMASHTTFSHKKINIKCKIKLTTKLKAHKCINVHAAVRFEKIYMEMML